LMRTRLSSYDRKISKLERELKFCMLFPSCCVANIRKSLRDCDAKRKELREKMKSTKRCKA